MRARLGDQVEEEQTRIHEAAEVSRKRKKTHSSGNWDCNDKKLRYLLIFFD